MCDIGAMSVRVRDLLMRELDTLRYEPIDKRIRAAIGDETVIDSTRAMLVWEPKRVVPTYAVPVEDVAGEILSEPRTETGDVDATACRRWARRSSRAASCSIPASRSPCARPRAIRW